MSQSAVPQHFQVDFRPVAAPEATVTGPHIRLTVLTSRLLRLEYSPDSSFEDRPSQAFWYRRQPVPEVQVRQTPEQIEIVTDHLHLRYGVTGRGFHHRTLSVELRQTGLVWRYGDSQWPHNLLGTARTLDEANGPVRLEPGLMSRAGWALVDDSASLVFDERGWLVPRQATGRCDLYFFGYGHDYQACLEDFCRVAGPMPMIPRWALGNWWSRYWAYSQEELAELMEAFRAQQVPLSVCIVDMDWHITDTGNRSRGWTGYTWNRQLFPDPEGFIRWLHGQGLRTALNLHPADGIHPHEAAYADMALRLNLDPDGGDHLPFDIVDPAFAAAYFELLHHPIEAQGIDFWWLDWQQGTQTKLSGLDPLWWLNHLHFLDSGRDGQRRPFIFSRWGGLGNHRYPIGFSGDTVVSWESLAFQPYFTATAANVGYGWWSHDIGGHWGGIEDRELFTRWVQYGVFSPIMRLHSTKNPYHERHPWGWDAEVLRVTRQALQLRHALIPYLYSAAWQATRRSVPPIRPMYHGWPEAEDAYHCPNQYLFGSELLAAPFVTPADPEIRLSHQAVWLPEGDWFDFFSGEYRAGGRWHQAYGELADIPVFAPAGAIVPLGPRVGWGGVDNPDDLTLRIFPGADGSFELYEDAGDTQGYLRGEFCVTTLSQTCQDGRLTFTVSPAQGDTSLIPQKRTLRLEFCGVRLPEAVGVSLNGIGRTHGLAYDAGSETLTLDGIVVRPNDELVVTLSSATEPLVARRDRRLETVRKLLRAFRLDSQVKQQIDVALPDLLAGKNDLMHHAARLTPGQLQALESCLDGR